VLQAGVKKTFNITKDAVAIMFYGIGYAIVNEALHDEKIKTLENRFNSEITGEEKILQYPSGGWHIYPITISHNDTFRINSAVTRQAYTLSSTTDSSSQYRLDSLILYSNEDYIFTASQNAVAFAFYNTGDVSFEKIGTLCVDVENIKSKTRDIIAEKKDSVVGLGNNTITPNQFIGELTPGVKYYVYVNNFKHTSATSGTLFGIGKLGSNLFINVQVGKSLNPPYEFVAEAGTYYYLGRCDSDDSIEVEFLTRPKEASIDIDAIKKICLNDDQTSLLNSITNSVSSNTKLCGFLHVTDLHSKFASLNEMIRIKSVLSLTSVNAMLNSGDIVGGWPKDELGNLVTAISEYMQICENNNKIYHVLGQHEVGFAPSANPDADSGRLKIRVLSHQECFNTYFAPLKSGWGLSSLDKCYYYKDFGDVRLICLYHYNRPEVNDPDNPTTMYKYQRALVWYGTEQLQWFADTLNSMSSGQVAVIMCHQPTKSFQSLTTSKFQSGRTGSAPGVITADDPITEIINAFKNKTTLNKAYTPTNTTKYLVADGFEESVNVDFSNANGTFGFMIMGDNHYDAVGRLNGVLCLCLTGSGECTDGVMTNNTGYISDFIINAFGVKSDSVELGRVGQQYFCGVKRDIERLDYTQS